MSTKYTYVLLIACYMQFAAGSYYPQYSQVYRYKSCLGPATNFLETTTNVTDEYSAIEFKSVYGRGLWKLEWNIGTTIVSGRSGGRACLTHPVSEGETVVLENVKKLAYGDLDDSVLTLYPLRYFDGEPVVIDDKGVSKIDIEDFKIGSWALTGTQSFTVFDEENYKGNAICLEVNSNSRDNGFGISVSWVEAELVVKSVKVGCDGSKKMRRLRGNQKKNLLTRDKNGMEMKEGILGKMEVLPKVIVVG